MSMRTWYVLFFLAVVGVIAAASMPILRERWLLRNRVDSLRECKTLPELERRLGVGVVSLPEDPASGRLMNGLVAGQNLHIRYWRDPSGVFEAWCQDDCVVETSFWKVPADPSSSDSSVENSPSNTWPRFGVR
jgi:hypothetical protein